MRTATTTRIFFRVRDAVIPFRRRKIEKLLEELGPLNGKICIDAGANVGNVTAVLLRKGAKVYAFEPDYSTYQILRNRFPIHSDRLVCIPKGVWNADGELPLFQHKNCAGDPARYGVSSSVYAAKRNVEKKFIQMIEVVDIARFISDLKDVVALVKLDIEGAELRVLPHMFETEVVSLVEKIYVETHESSLPSLRGEFEKLRCIIARNPELSRKIKLNWI